MSVKQGIDSHIMDSSNLLSVLNFLNNFHAFVMIFRVSLIVLIIVSVFLMPSVAHSHKVNIFAYAEDGRIFTESYFNDGSPCNGSMIQVYDKEGNEILQGKTDEEGNFSFKVPNNIPKKTDLKIVLTASMGHRAEYLMPASELYSKIESSALSQKTQKIEPPSFIEGKSGGIADQNNIGDNSAPPGLAVDLDQIRSVVEEAVDRSIEKRMKPLMNSLIHTIIKAQTNRVSFRDIIGGIGYIFGIMGLILYFKKREK
jgi:nickel transport protein